MFRWRTVIAVALLTCDRLAYTRQTVQSFAAHNDTSRFLLLHADDASTDTRVLEAAQAYGFETVVQSRQRQGWLLMRTRLFEAAQQRGAEWVIFLENDHEWARPFPWELFAFVQSKPQFYCLRLYGAFKDREGLDPSFPYNKRDRRTPVKWMALKHAPEPAQAALIHWSAQPSVTKIGPLLDHHRYGIESPDLTVRVTENVTYHIGVERTTPLQPAVPA